MLSDRKAAIFKRLNIYEFTDNTLVPMYQHQVDTTLYVAEHANFIAFQIQVSWFDVRLICMRQLCIWTRRF